MQKKPFKTISLYEKDNFSINFLYKTIIGRLFLKFLISKKISKFFGKLMDSKFSNIFISRFINKNNIDTKIYENRKYTSFNDFFKRKKLDKFLEFPKDNTAFCSPCDGKLSVYKISEDAIFKIKNLQYDLLSLLQDEDLKNEFKNATILIFRLTPDNYHRFHFIDDGKIIFSKKIDGSLHTVRPIAFKNHKVFIENQREITLLETENFQRIIQIEVGALFVGRIKNKDIKNFKRGQEKGYFEFGGSTVILILKENVNIFDEILKNTKNNKETIVQCAEKIGNIIK